MKRFRVWGASAALAVGLGGPVAVAADPAVPQTTLMKKLFGPKPPKPAGPRAGGDDRPVTITAPLAPEVLADALRAEQDAYLRRVSICTELRRVAIEKGDASLERQADELERQATALYNNRVAGLGVSRQKGSVPDSSAAFSSFDSGSSPSRIADQARRLEAPAAPVASPTAKVREVKP